MNATIASSLELPEQTAADGEIGAFRADAAPAGLETVDSVVACAFNSSHWRAVEETAAALDEGRSILLIAGEAESGLVATAREAAQTLPKRFTPVWISARGLNGFELAGRMANALCGESQGEAGVAALDALRGRLEQLAGFDAAVVFFVSHADALDVDGLAILERLAAHGRRLGRLREAASEAGVECGPVGAKFVLLAREELIARLEEQKDGAMRQAAADAAVLRDFLPDEVRAYLRRRLSDRNLGQNLEHDASGAPAEPITKAAIDRVARLTGGRPERLGAFCAHPLLAELAQLRRVADLDEVERIAADLDLQEVEGAPVDGDETRAAAAGGREHDVEELDVEAMEIEAWVEIERGAEQSQRLAAELVEKMQEPARSPLVLLAKRLAKAAARRAAEKREQLFEKLRRNRDARLEAKARARGKPRHRTVTHGETKRRFVAAIAAIAIGCGLAVISVLVPQVLVSPPGETDGLAGAPKITDESSAAPVLDLVDNALVAAESAARAVVGDDTAESISGDVAETRADLLRSRARSGVDGLDPAVRAAEIERRLGIVLDVAEMRIKSGQLTEPEGESAYDALLRGYFLAPQDPRVLAGLDELVARYDTAGKEALRREQFSEYYRINKLIDRIKLRRPL